jgi:nucleoside-diphosphate-sugar epimerase
VNKTICILGFGYTAKFLAEKLSKINFSITGTSRNLNVRDYYQKKGYEIVDFNDIQIEHILYRSTHLLILIPPVPLLGDPALTDLLALLEKYSRRLEWVGYVSSTGIYGNHDGAWVDEFTLPKNIGIRSALRLEAEMAWLDVSKKFQLPIHIFRLAAIYGPNRNVLSDIANGKDQSVYKEGHFFSRIHVEDIAKIILASIQKPNIGSVYNISDDLPAPSHEIDQYAASLLKRDALPLVPFEKAVLSDQLKEFYGSNRRVSNAKIKQEFKLRLNYPSYREGLKQLYQDGDY